MLSNYTLDTVITHWKDEHDWLYQAPSQSLQQVSKDLVSAIFNAFNPEMPQAFPTFKRKGDGDSFRVPQGFVLDTKKQKVYIPNIGWLSSSV